MPKRHSKHRALQALKRAKPEDFALDAERSEHIFQNALAALSGSPTQEFVRPTARRVWFAVAGAAACLCVWLSLARYLQKPATTLAHTVPTLAPVPSAPEKPIHTVAIPANLPRKALVKSRLAPKPALAVWRNKPKRHINPQAERVMAIAPAKNELVASMSLGSPNTFLKEKPQDGYARVRAYNAEGSGEASWVEATAREDKAGNIETHFAQYSSKTRQCLTLLIQDAPKAP